MRDLDTVQAKIAEGWGISRDITDRGRAIIEAVDAGDMAKADALADEVYLIQTAVADRDTLNPKYLAEMRAIPADKEEWQLDLRTWGQMLWTGGVKVSRNFRMARGSEEAEALAFCRMRFESFGMMPNASVSLVPALHPTFATMAAE